MTEESNDTIFLTLEEVLKIHKDQIDRYGGMHGLREKGLLESALAQAEVSFGGVYLVAVAKQVKIYYFSKKIHFSRCP